MPNPTAGNAADFPPHRGWQRAGLQRALPWALLLAVTLPAAFLLVKCDIAGGIEASRLATVQSLVDDGCFEIDRSIFHTSDRGMLHGKMYSDKPPLLTWLSAGQYWLMAKFGGLTFRTHYHLVIFLLYLPYFLFLPGTGIACYFALNRYIGRSSPAWYRAGAAALAVLSTLMLSYSVTVGNHPAAAFLLMLLLLQLDSAERDRWPSGRAFWCGVLTGLIFNCEFVFGGVFGLAVFALILSAHTGRVERARAGCAYAAGAFLLLGAEAAMNTIAYGSALPLYLLSHRPDMAHKNYLEYAWNALFGFEGFFLYMPACLFIFPVLMRPFPGRGRVAACMLSGCLGAAVLFVLTTSDYGGFCYGFRFLIPAAPVLLFYVFLSFQARRRRGWCDLLLAGALLWGVVVSLVGTFNPWNTGFEGSSTPKGDFCENARNGFLGNVLVWCFEYAPDSAPTRYLIERVYGPVTAYRYLFTEFRMRRDVPMQQRVDAWFRENAGPRPGHGK